MVTPAPGTSLSLTGQQWLLARLLISDPRGHRSLSWEQSTSGVTKTVPVSHTQIICSVPTAWHIHPPCGGDVTSKRQKDRRIAAPERSRWPTLSFSTRMHSQY